MLFRAGPETRTGAACPTEWRLSAEAMKELLRNDILVEDSTCVVRYNSLGSSRSPGCNYRSPTQDRAVCDEAAAVSALSGKMMHRTVRFCARGARQNGHES